MANRVKTVERIREAARTLYPAVEESRSTVDEYVTNGGAAWTDPFFHEGEDVNNPLRTDLDISKEDLTAGEVALDAIANGNMAPGSNINDYLPALSKIK